MSQEIYNNPNQNQNNEDVDLIRLLNYFKNGIKSIFRGIWKLMELIIRFIILLKKNWVLVIGLAALGAVYGKFILPILTQNNTWKVYEMVVKATPLSNYELYALSYEINNEDDDFSNSKDEGKILSKKLGIKSMEVESIAKLDDVVNSYFENTETATLRGFDTDSLFYQDFELKGYESQMKNTDYSFQRIKMKIENGNVTKETQSKFINYLNELPGIKREQEAKLMALTMLENQLKSGLQNIDSLLVSRISANKNSITSNLDQTIFNTASRNNVETDLLRVQESFSKRLYGTMRMKSDVEKGVQVISNLRAVGNKDVLSNSMVKYTLYGFILACLIVLGIQFNKYLNNFARKI